MASQLDILQLLEKYPEKRFASYEIAEMLGVSKVMVQMKILRRFGMVYHQYFGGAKGYRYWHKPAEDET